MLDALSTRLMDPALFAVFCEEFVAETNRLRAAKSGARAAQEAELAKLKRDLDRLLQTAWKRSPAYG